MLTESSTPPPLPTDFHKRAAITAGRIAINADTLAANLAGRPSELIATFEWFRHHCLARGLSYEAAAKKLHKDNGNAYSRDSVYQALTGARGLEVNLDPLARAIERYRRNVETPVPVDGFIPTRMAHEIATYVERVRKRQKVGFVVGQNACGKSTALGHIERNDARVSVVRMPEGGHRSAFLKALSRRRGYGDKQTPNDVANRLIADFTPGADVLCVDEGDECFQTRSTRHTETTLAYIRRLRDDARIGVVFIMDPAGYRKLQTVEETDPLRKLYSRREPPLLLPAFYSEDLDLFAAQHGLEPAPDAELKITKAYSDNPKRVQDAVCGSHRDGLFVWLGIFADAEELAGSQTLTWEWVLKAYTLYLAQETGRAK